MYRLLNPCTLSSTLNSLTVFRTISFLKLICLTKKLAFRTTKLFTSFMTIYFVSGNADKYREACLSIPELVQLAISLPEIQELDNQKILEEKLKSAVELCQPKNQDYILVEDVSLACQGINGLPGPLVKWFLQSLGVKGLADLILRSDKCNATVTCVLGIWYLDEFHYRQASINGKIVAPRGESFGWDPLFQPDGCALTYGEMNPQQKMKCSARRKVLLQFYQDFILSDFTNKKTNFTK